MAEKILRVLESQAFADWYGPGGKFDDFIRGEDGQTPWQEQQAEILKQIKKKFRL